MRVLVIASMLPFPQRSGGALRLFHVLHALSQRHDVTLAGFSFGGEQASTLGIRVLPVAWSWPPAYRALHGSDPAAAAAASDELGQTRDEPWLASFYESAKMSRLLRKEARLHDLAVLAGSDMGRFLPDLPVEMPVVLDLMDVESGVAVQRLERSAAADRQSLAYEAERIRRFESRLAQRARLCLVCSPSEADVARRLLGVGRPQIVPNGVDTAYFRPDPDGSPGAAPTGEAPSLLFVGHLGHPPNREGLQWFIDQVLPRVRDMCPDARLDVVGRGGGPSSVEALLQSKPAGVAVHGEVADTLPHQHRATVVVVPIRTGGGTRLKVLEAAACGNAIVATRLGADGIELRDGQSIVLADTAPAMASAIAELLASPARRAALGAAARQIAQAYAWPRIEARLLALIDDLMTTAATQATPQYASRRRS